MAKTPGQFDPLTPSLMDRLRGGAGASDTPAGQRPYQLLAELRRSVRRDLECLLNTRWRCTEADQVPAGLENSLVNYGLPDFSGGNLQAAQDPQTVYDAVERAIQRFEPRLSGVRVRPLDDDQAVDRTLRFQIEAVLEVEPWHERVRFNTVLEPASGKVTVKAVEKSA
jgi:type VI secretion system protein ImpF